MSEGVIVSLILIAIIAIVAIAAVIITVVKLKKLSPEERKKKILTFLKGAVALAQNELSKEQGAEKLELVQKYFEKNAPWFIKLLFKISGEDNLKDLIELALEEIKKDFIK